MRESIQPTYDSRETGPRYHVTSAVNGRPVAWQEPTADPFVRHTVTLGWRDLLRAVRLRRLEVAVTISADGPLIDDVLELDANTLIPGSTRQAAFRQDMHEALGAFAPEPDPEMN